MTTVTDRPEVLPVEYTKSPFGVLHIITQHPDVDATLCGESVRTPKAKKPWALGDGTQTDIAATCLTCRIVLSRRNHAVHLGNYMAEDGLDVCECGCQYWERDTCVECGAEWNPDCREDND